jgi:ribonuclease P protein component
MIVKNRIKKYSEFQKVIEFGEVKKTSFFVSYTIPNELGYSRFGISVPKKTGNAVIRNRIKRQVRSAIGKSTSYEKSVDVVLIVRKSYDVENFEQILSEIKEIIEK